MTKEELRRLIDKYELWKKDDEEGYNVAADHLVNELYMVSGMVPQEYIVRAREAALTFYDSCKRPDLKERDKVNGALTKYQMSMDASMALAKHLEGGKK